jgi:hypothetical protein
VTTRPRAPLLVTLYGISRMGRSPSSFSLISVLLHGEVDDEAHDDRDRQAYPLCDDSSHVTPPSTSDSETLPACAASR